MGTRAWILAVLCLAPAGVRAQEDDLPDNTAAFREDPFGVNLPELYRARERAQTSPLPGERALVGTLVRVAPEGVWLEHAGVLVPFAVTPRTRLEGAPGMRVDALSPGQELRARFDICGGENVATELELLPGPSSRPAPQVTGTPSGLGPRSPGRVPSVVQPEEPASSAPTLPRE